MSLSARLRFLSFEKKSLSMPEHSLSRIRGNSSTL